MMVNVARTPPTPSSDGDLSLTPAFPLMADSNSAPSIVATPYPTYISPGGDGDGDDSFRAALIVQGDASTQRNQDSQFAALRSEHLTRDVADGKRETVQAKYDALVQAKDAEVRNADRFASLEKELAAMRAEATAREVASLRVELAESRADGRQASIEATLAKILAKVSS